MRADAEAINLSGLIGYYRGVNQSRQAEPSHPIPATATAGLPVIYAKPTPFNIDADCFSGGFQELTADWKTYTNLVQGHTGHADRDYGRVPEHPGASRCIKRVSLRTSQPSGNGNRKPGASVPKACRIIYETDGDEHVRNPSGSRCRTRPCCSNGPCSGNSNRNSSKLYGRGD
jgi:hypothetical protein